MSYKLQLAKGKKVEREHLDFYHQIKKKDKFPSDKKFTEGIAKAHIKEFPKGNYYDELSKMEKKLKYGK
jgi:hypothetical protein